MNVSTAEKLAGGDADLTATIVELARAEKNVLSEIADLERRLGEVRRALAVGETSSDVYNAGTVFASLLVRLGQRDVLLARLTRAGVDLTEVRKAGRR